MRRVGLILRVASKFVSGIALAAAIMVGAALTSQSAHAITINYALSSEGASFVSASSEIGAGNAMQMQNNLLLPDGSKVDWFGNGDTRFTFGANDPNGTIEIDLGQVRQVTDIGTRITQDNRPTTGPITIQVSLNGSTWTDWGLPVTVTGSTNEVTVNQPIQGVEFIKYSYGPTGDPYGGFGGSAVGSIFADVDPVPLPATWTMLIVGFAGLGFFACRAKSRASDAFAAG
jgi:hypothetical protein